MAERIGFVGLGLMGHPMAHGILTKGYPLTVLAHRRREAVDDLIGKGATEAPSPAALAEASDIILLCLTGSPQVAEIVADMKPSLRRDQVIVDCSTSDPVVTDRLGEELAQMGVALVDAPLSRTPKDAWQRNLDVMVGAVTEVLERVTPILECFAGRVVHVGGPGDGHKMKLLNNFLSLGYAALYSEALAMSRKVGIPVENFDAVIRGGRMDCGFYQTFMGYALEGNREAHRFTIANAYKDLRYLESMGNAAVVSTQMASAVKNAFASAMAQGGDGPEDYVPHLSDFVARANGL